MQYLTEKIAVAILTVVVLVCGLILSLAAGWVLTVLLAPALRTLELAL